MDLGGALEILSPVLTQDKSDLRLRSDGECISRCLLRIATPGPDGLVRKAWAEFDDPTSQNFDQESSLDILRVS